LDVGKEIQSSDGSKEISEYDNKDDVHNGGKVEEGLNDLMK
jgi:hypothetical protein